MAVFPVFVVVPPASPGHLLSHAGSATPRGISLGIVGALPRRVCISLLQTSLPHSKPSISPRHFDEALHKIQASGRRRDEPQLGARVHVLLATAPARDDVREAAGVHELQDAKHEWHFRLESLGDPP